jgi:hypothetical protein
MEYVKAISERNCADIACKVQAPAMSLVAEISVSSEGSILLHPQGRLPAWFRSG